MEKTEGEGKRRVLPLKRLKRLGRKDGRGKKEKNFATVKTEEEKLE